MKELKLLYSNIRFCFIVLSVCLLIISLACNIFSSFADTLRELADKLETEDQQSPNEIDQNEMAQDETDQISGQTEEQQPPGSSIQFNGNSSSQGTCSEYEGLIIYQRSIEEAETLKNDLVIADENGNAVYTIPGQSGTLIGFGDPAWSPNHCRIVFSAKERDENNINLFTMDPDGTDIVQLTFEPTYEYHADWSPDGTKIVYVVGTYPEVQVDDNNNTNPLPQQDVAPGVAGDSNQTGAAVADNNNSDTTFQTGKQTRHLWIMNADGSDKHLLTDEDDILDDPEWSQNGKQIVFECLNRNHLTVSPTASLGGICLIDPDGNNFIRLTPEDHWGYLYPAWSPDSEKIVMQTNAFNSEITFGIINTDGSWFKSIHVNNSRMIMCIFNKWSPDGTKIIYNTLLQEIDGVRYYDRLMVLDINSNTVAPLTNEDASFEGFPDW